MVEENSSLHIVGEVNTVQADDSGAKTECTESVKTSSEESGSETGLSVTGDRECVSSAKPLPQSCDQTQGKVDECCTEVKEEALSVTVESEILEPSSGESVDSKQTTTFTGQKVVEAISPDSYEEDHTAADSASGVSLRSSPVPPPVRPKPRKRTSVSRQLLEEDVFGEHSVQSSSLSAPSAESGDCESTPQSAELAKADDAVLSLNLSESSSQDHLDGGPHQIPVSDHSSELLKESCLVVAEADCHSEPVSGAIEESLAQSSVSQDDLCPGHPAQSVDSDRKEPVAVQSCDEEPKDRNENCSEATEEIHLPLTLQDVGDTCGMLKEIEDLLNERFKGAVESESSTHATSADTDSTKVHDSSTPSRPPRPRRANKLKHLGLDSSSVDSSSTESLTSVGLSGKKAPPKPKRKHLPGSVSRSLSDVTGMKNIIDQLNKEEEEEEKPFLPPRQQSLRLPSSPKPPPLPPRNKSMDQPREGTGTCGSGSKGDAGEATPSTGAAPGAGLGSSRGRSGRKNIPRPTRKAPPPPPHAPRRISTPAATPEQNQNLAAPSSSQSSSGGSVDKETGYRKIVNGSSPASADINTVVPKTGVVGSLDSPSAASEESMDHDYHEIPDHLVKDLSSQLAKVAAERLKEESPPPVLPPRSYQSQPEEQSSHKHPEQDGKDSAETPELRTKEKGTPEPQCTKDDSSHPDTSGESVSHSSNESPRPASFSGASGSLLEVVGERGRPASSVSLHSGSSHSDTGSGGQEVPTFDQLSSGSEDEENEDDEEKKARKREKKVYFIAEEVVKSEQVFVDVLKLLNVDFRVFISQRTEQVGHSIVPSETLNKILDFLPQLQSFNEMLLKDLKDRIANWDKHKKIADIFVKKGPFLKLYSSYIRNFEHATALLDETCKKHNSFGQALQQFELSPRCASLALKHYMLKPIQRIPQYKLLLQDYLKHLADDSPDHKDTITALSIVSEVADHANESMRHGDNVQKLLEIQRSLIGQFEVIQPGRVLIKQGELMKLSRKEMQPRMFFLFSDVLLYTTPTTSGYRLNNILPLNGMKVVPPKLEEFKNEFNIISTQRSFTVAASTPDEREHWLTALWNAIEDNSERYHTFKSMQPEPQTSLLDKDFVLGHKAPLWVPDARVTMCMLCLAEFSITWRRHHCRACGRIICGNCSENKAPLRYLMYKSHRVCDDCFEKLSKEVEEHLKEGEEKDADDAAGATAAEAGGLSLSSIKARFQKIRKSAREKRKSGMVRPSVLKEVHANDEGSDMSGYLWVAKNKKWKRLWFVVKGKVLYTYKASEDMAAIESMPLLGFEITRMTAWYQGAEPDLMFELKHQNTQPLVFKSRNSSSSSDKGVGEDTASSASAVSPQVKSSADTTTPRLIFRTDSAAATTKWLNILREASLA